MPKLEGYRHSLSYSYAPGLFPATECLRHAGSRCQRLLLSTKIRMSEDVQALIALAETQGVRIEYADRALERLSQKENCYAAAVFRKEEGQFAEDAEHIVLNEPSDLGNLGTIMRTALGFGFLNLAIIRPAADSDDPKTVRASMGAVFSLNVRHFDSIDAYQMEFGNRALYPFMLTGSVLLEDAVRNREKPYSLVFGNEATGLPERFAEWGTPVRIPHSGDIDSLNLSIAAGIGMYAFAHADQTI